MNAVLINNPESAWHTWPGIKNDPRIVGANWIWYAANSNTFNGAVDPNDPNQEYATFMNSTNVPGIPIEANLYLMADDGIQVNVNNGSNLCPIVYCPTGNCSTNQNLNECNITSYLKSGQNDFKFVVNNYNTNGGIVYKATVKTDCGLQ